MPRARCLRPAAIVRYLLDPAVIDGVWRLMALANNHSCSGFASAAAAASLILRFWTADTDSRISKVIVDTGCYVHNITQ